MKKHIAVLAFIVIMAVAGGLAVKAQSSAPYDIHGWAWSANTGWISFNSTDAGAGGGPYKVQLDASGNLNGHAWSSNVGWIKFGGLSGFPSGGGVTSNNAQVNVNNGNVSGWVRACGGTATSSAATTGDCSVMTSRTDGWDGWIALAGTEHPTGNSSGYLGTSTQGVTLKTTTNGAVRAGVFSGYAWDANVGGWIQFHPGVTSAVICDNNCGLAVSPTAAISAAPGSVPVDTVRPTITWSSTNSTECTGTNFSTGGAVAGNAPGQYQSSQMTYTVTCSGPTGSPATASVIVPVDNEPPPQASGIRLMAVAPPTVSLPTDIFTSSGGSNKTATVKRGQPFKIQWNIDPTLLLSVCIPSVDTGTWSTWTTLTSIISNNLTIQTTDKAPGVYNFTLTCNQIGGGTKSSSATVNITSSTIEET